MNNTIRRVCKTTAIAYVLAWIIGLSSGGPSLKLGASGSTVAHEVAAHKMGMVLQFVFSEGTAGLMLLILVVAALMGWRRDSKNGLRKSQLLFGVSGIVACLMSLTMCVLGIVLAVSVVPHGTAAQAAHLNDLINRMDGPKMWLLGLMAIGGVRAVPSLARWLKITGYALAIWLAVSGIAYGFLLQSLNWSVYISGVLLLVWVCGFGVTLFARTSQATKKA